MGSRARIAVLRFSSLGDVLCTGPAVRGLKRAFPDSEIVYLTTGPYRELAAALPGVDRVAVVSRRGAAFTRDLRALAGEGGWDAVADLQGSPRSRIARRALAGAREVVDKPPRLRRFALLAGRVRIGRFLPVPKRMLANLAPWGVEDDAGSLAVEIAETARDAVRERWGGWVEDAVVTVPGAKHATKCWPGSYWRDLVEALPDEIPVVALGSAGELPDELRGLAGGRVLDLTGETSILESAAVLERARVVICGDTGPMHLAVAAGAPLVALFGPTVREFGFFPFRHTHSVVLERPLACRPCSAHGSSRCPLGHHRCLREIRPWEVLAAAAGVLRSAGRFDDAAELAHSAR